MKQQFIKMTKFELILTNINFKEMVRFEKSAMLSRRNENCSFKFEIKDILIIKVTLKKKK